MSTFEEGDPPARLPAVATLEIPAQEIDSLGVARVTVEGEWNLRYFNIRNGVTDIVLVPRGS